LLPKDLVILFDHVLCIILADDIHSNIDASAGATTQGRVQLAKASKSVKSKTSWVSHKDLIILILKFWLYRIDIRI